MVLGDYQYRCSQTLEDLHLSSAQYSAYYLQASMHLKPISKSASDAMIVDDSDKENMPVQAQVSIVPDGVVDLTEGKSRIRCSSLILLLRNQLACFAGTPIDLRRMIFVNRSHSLPEHRCCRIYYR
ncbi:hypothetical protein EON65_12280 [archaeon]|nr:MAG: hypothetical protein EON65_12280 [archaeon]